MSKGRNEILKREREQRGWSQARLAELIGTDAATVSRWERGYATPSPYFREHLCRLFEKSTQDLGLLLEKQAESEQKPSPSPSKERWSGMWTSASLFKTATSVNMPSSEPLSIFNSQAGSDFWVALTHVEVRLDSVFSS